MDVLAADLTVAVRWVADVAPYFIAPLVFLLLWEVVILLAAVITTGTER